MTINLTDDIAVIGPILRALRNTLDQPLFDRRLASALQNGYRAFVTADASACLGFHITHDVCWGKTFYVDDLVVLPHLRGTGIGAALLDRAKVKARALGCDHIRLCSGLTRKDAHRFYETNGIIRTSLQFSHSIDESAS